MRVRGTGFIAVADNGGEGIEHVECGQHHPAFKDAPSVDELLAHTSETRRALAASFSIAKLTVSEQFLPLPRSVHQNTERDRKQLERRR